MNKPKFKRRKYFIDKKFQAEFIIRYCLLVAFGSLLTVVLVYWLAQRSTTVAIINGHVAVHTTAEYLLPLMTQTVFIELAIVSVFTGIMALLVSHKIVGPLYRLKTMFTSLGGGDLLSRMHLRKGDQLQDVAQAYNEAVDKLRHKVNRLKHTPSAEELKRELDQFKT